MGVSSLGLVLEIERKARCKGGRRSYGTSVAQLANTIFLLGQVAIDGNFLRLLAQISCCIYRREELDLN